MAVQLISYEIRMAYLAATAEVTSTPANVDIYPSMQELEYFYHHTEQLYQSLGFIQNQGVMQKLRRFIRPRRVGKNGTEYPAWNVKRGRKKQKSSQ